MGLPLPSDDGVRGDDGNGGNAAAAERVDDLLMAARYGDLEDVMLLHPQLKDAQNAQGCTALHMASANGHLDVVRYLVGNGANVNIANAEQNTPLHWAALNGQIEVCQELLSRGASPFAVNSYDRTPVDEALSKGHMEIVEAISTSTAAASLDQTSIS